MISFLHDIYRNRLYAKANPLNYADILKDEVKYETVYAGMLHWYRKQITANPKSSLRSF
jgi:hypothetical protein